MSYCIRQKATTSQKIVNVIFCFRVERFKMTLSERLCLINSINRTLTRRNTETDN